jgi:hypothetical protein
MILPSIIFASLLYTLLILVSILPESFDMSRGECEGFPTLSWLNSCWVRISGTIAKLMLIEFYEVICIKLYFCWVVSVGAQMLHHSQQAGEEVESDSVVDKSGRYLFDRQCLKVYTLSIALMPVLPCDNTLEPKLVLANGSH